MVRIVELECTDLLKLVQISDGVSSDDPSRSWRLTMRESRDDDRFDIGKPDGGYLGVLATFPGGIAHFGCRVKCPRLHLSQIWKRERWRWNQEA